MGQCTRFPCWETKINLFIVLDKTIPYGSVHMISMLETKINLFIVLDKRYPYGSVHKISVLGNKDKSIYSPR